MIILPTFKHAESIAIQSLYLYVNVKLDLITKLYYGKKSGLDGYVFSVNMYYIMSLFVSYEHVHVSYYPVMNYLITHSSFM